jgi:Nif-specific regulatory protein
MADKILSQIRDIPKGQLDVLYHISEILNVASMSDNLMEQVLDMVIDFLNAERGLFTKYEHESRNFDIIAARNIKQNSITDLDTFSSGILRRVIEQQKALLYHDAQQDPATSQFESVQLQAIKSVIGVPVYQQERIWGVILVDSRENRKEFTNENLFFLEFFARLVSLVLDKITGIEALQDENIRLRNQLEGLPVIPAMIGDSPAMRTLAKLIHRVAQTDASVLLLGESGTGKELAARAIHDLSPRRDKPFLAQFCGSIPDTLLESELFGYKKGAFSGAYADKKGLFEVADQGSFFLDEIGDISLALQAKLLRVLENREIIRLGDTKVKKVDVRIIAATNQDLPAMVKQGRFREDLFYRLNVFPVTLPPLRERKGDIPILARHFLSKNGRKVVRLSAAAVQRLNAYHWPGNIRQLQNVLQRAQILCDNDRIGPEHILLEESENLSDFKGTLKDFEQLLLKKRLEEFAGNRTLTAKSLGTSVRWVQLKLKEKNEQ